VIVSPTADKVKAVAKELGCGYAVADVADYESIKKAVTETEAKYGRIDCLINNAGLWIQGEVDENEADKIKQVISVNTLGVMLATKAVIPVMKQQKAGLIININSAAGINSKPERAVYIASKWAVTGFTRSLQPELAKYGIGVTGILPGGMKTAMFDKSGNPKDQSQMLDPAEVAKLIEFILTLEPTTVLPEVGIKYITN
jgi:NADP-dependent 3-hydroxy acid dehydrogenase YdfG